MSTATSLLLIAATPAQRWLSFLPVSSSIIFGGAHLVDLAIAGRVQLQGPPKREKVVVIDPRLISEPDVESGFAQIRNTKPASAQATLGKLGEGSEKNVAATLAQRGQVRLYDRRLLGFPSQKVELVDTAGRAQLVEGIRLVLLHNGPVNQALAPIIGMLDASSQLGLVLNRQERKHAKAVVKRINEGNWATEGVREAVAATHAATMTAVGMAMAASVVASGNS